ncbi:hypothetical protein L0156_11960 [bacterium]|nr:hypothetical protein [bacterium]
MKDRHENVLIFAAVCAVVFFVELPAHKDRRSLNSDPSGLKVQKCCAPNDIGGLRWTKIAHCWIKTDKYEAGMGHLVEVFRLTGVLQLSGRK